MKRTVAASLAMLLPLAAVAQPRPFASGPEP